MPLRSLAVLVAGAMLVALAAAGCSKGNPAEPTGPRYAALVLSGWDAFVHQFYDLALQRFDEAISLEPGSAPAYGGAGWSLIRLDSLDAASALFTAGAAKPDPPPDLYAGWAFLLETEHQWSASIARASSVLAADSAWVFSGGASMDWVDLRLLMAWDHYRLGEFDASLAELRHVDPGFDADVSTASGQLQLAARIEELGGISESPALARRGAERW